MSWMNTDGGWRLSPVRRWFDAILAALALVVLAPVIAVVAIVVRFRVGGPVLFRHERSGLDGSPFEVRKFRTMTDDCLPDGSLLPDGDRLTPLGRKLRSTSLDELPQLWSVIRGDMSLIGPRPLPTRYAERYDDAQRRRLLARPGITGWAQVQGRNSLTWPEKLALDVWWIDNASPWLDMRILMMTVASVLRRSDVNAGTDVTMPEFRQPELIDEG